MSEERFAVVLPVIDHYRACIAESRLVYRHRRFRLGFIRRKCSAIRMTIRVNFEKLEKLLSHMRVN